MKFIFCILLGIAIATADIASAKSILEPGQVLHQDQQLTSTSGSFYAYMQADGNLVVYLNIKGTKNKVLWASGTNGDGSPKYRLTMQGDNNLVIYDGFGAAIWSTGTVRKGTAGAKLAMQNDGNLVLYDGAGRALWATGSNRYRALM